MSSTYRIICLSHDPALVIDEPEWQSMPDALAGLAAGLPGHPSCELLIGRFSYPLVEVCCPRQHTSTYGATHPHSDEWVDAAWLRLLLLAGSDAASAARVLGCWTYERAHRLRAELLDELPARDFTVVELSLDTDPNVFPGCGPPQVVAEELSVKAVYEKLNALPPRDRAGARWVMSWSTMESLCALAARPKPLPGVAVTLVGLPVDFDDTAVGVELRPASSLETVALWP